MNTKDLLDHFDDLDDDDKLSRALNVGRRPRNTGRHPKKMPMSDQLFVHKQDDSRSTFKFSYKAARFEEWWLLESLGAFYEHKWISDVTRRVKGGKEASVYQCKPGTEVDVPLLAAKVYRPRSLRNLKNDQQYRVGRTDLDEDGHALWKEADVNAIIKRTRYGEEVRHQSWISYELVTMEILFAAGADVPRPFAKEKNAILMEFIGDDGTPAPPLSHIALEQDEAQPLFERVVRNLDIMLSKDRIHGDLSAYNILYWDGDIKLIDFPQVVIPESNPSSWGIFQRDVMRICQYFMSQGVNCDPKRLAAELWTSHGHRVFEKIHPKFLDPENPEDRQRWDQEK
ncbi:MAG TPA: RIO1 family regulatory kinase/ATPase [Anaerolineales bacterium]|nr:RIO1 family regulatory kinase/ATPase [Anaerolineales bacterium]HNB36011.1 RIO1 family regulatory kinase/ATPase [Anaerolineales bacterium]